MPHRQTICVTKGNALSIYKPLCETAFKTSQTAVSHVTRCSKHHSTPSIIPRIHILIPFPEKKHQKPEAMVQSIFVHIVGAKWVSNIKGQWDDCHLRGGCPSTPIEYSHQTASLIWGGWGSFTNTSFLTMEPAAWAEVGTPQWRTRPTLRFKMVELP